MRSTLALIRSLYWSIRGGTMGPYFEAVAREIAWEIQSMTMAMSDELSSFDQRAVIKVCGVGGGGGNAVTRMIDGGMRDVDFIAINTDAQALKKSPAPMRLQIGADITNGLGSGAKPEIGQKAALEDRERINDVLRGADMVFVTAGMGGGTGTGAAPIVAETARATGALTVGIVTLPFSFEGKDRMKNALVGLRDLEEHVDTLIVVPNDRVARLCQDNVSLLNAFKQADEVLNDGVRAISELITIPGLINLDFADVRTIMQARGRALMGIGIAEGEKRSVRAAQEAIICPLLEQANIHGATGVVVNVKGGADMTMREIQDAVEIVQKSAHQEANIIFGAVVDDVEHAEIQVTVIAAGFQKGVSDAFLSEDQPAAQRIGQRQEKPDSISKPAQPSPAPAVSSSQEPAPTNAETELLFPEEETVPEKPVLRSEPEEDLNIPAFMRRRKKNQ